MVGSVPHRGIYQKECGDDGSFGRWPAFRGRPRALEEQNLVGGGGDGGNGGGGGGWPKPIKRLVEVGSLSIISLPGSTTTRGGVTPAGLGAAAGLRTLRSGQTLPYLASCSEAAGSESR